MVSKYQHCLTHTLLRAFSDTTMAASHQTEAGELSHDDWQDHSVQKSNTESTEEHQVTQVLMIVFYLIVFAMYTGFSTSSWPSSHSCWRVG